MGGSKGKGESQSGESLARAGRTGRGGRGGGRESEDTHAVDP